MLAIAFVFPVILLCCEGTIFSLPTYRSHDSHRRAGWRYDGQEISNIRPPSYSNGELEESLLDYWKTPRVLLLLLQRSDKTTKCCTDQSSQLSNNYPYYKGLLQFRISALPQVPVNMDKSPELEEGKLANLSETSKSVPSLWNQSNLKFGSSQTQNTAFGVISPSSVVNTQYEILPAPAAPSNYILQPTAQHSVRPLNSGQNVDQKQPITSSSNSQYSFISQGAGHTAGNLQGFTQQHPSPIETQGVITTQQQNAVSIPLFVPKPENQFSPPGFPADNLSSNATNGIVQHGELQHNTVQAVTNVNQVTSNVQTSTVSITPQQQFTQELHAQHQASAALPTLTSTSTPLLGPQQHAPPPPPPNSSHNDKVPSGTYIATVSYGPNHPSLIYSCTLTSLLNPLSPDMREYSPGPFGYSCKVSKGKPSLASHILEANNQQPVAHPTVPYGGTASLPTVVPVGLVSQDVSE